MESQLDRFEQQQGHRDKQSTSSRISFIIIFLQPTYNDYQPLTACKLVVKSDPTGIMLKFHLISLDGISHDPLVEE